MRWGKILIEVGKVHNSHASTCRKPGGRSHLGLP